MTYIYKIAAVAAYSSGFLVAGSEGRLSVYEKNEAREKARYYIYVISYRKGALSRGSRARVEVFFFFARCSRPARAKGCAFAGRNAKRRGFESARASLVRLREERGPRKGVLSRPAKQTPFREALERARF